jgi:hypothetical protein
MKSHLALVMAALASQVALGGVPSDVTVIRSDERSIVIEYSPRGVVERPISHKGKQFVAYDFDGAYPLADIRQPGVPDLKYRLLPLAFQAAEGNAVQVVAADYEDIPNVMLAPIPTVIVRDEMLDAKSYDTDPAAYGQNTFLPGPVAELATIHQSRSMLIGGVRVYPLQYNPATRTLRKYRRIVIEVSYTPSSARRIQNNDDELFEGMLLNHDVARVWKFGDERQLQRTTNTPSVLAQGSWYRLTVTEDGMYILNQQFLASNGINLSGVDPRTIKIFGGDGRELPEAVNALRPNDLVENAIYVEGESDGQFNAGDYVLFYGKGVQGITYDAVGRTLRHYIHHYSRVNYYWLTFGGAPGRRMAQQPTPTAPATVVPTRFLDATFIEPDTINIVRSGKDWVGPQIDPNGAYVRTLPLPGVIAGEPRTYRYALVSSSQSTSTFTVKEGTTPIGTHALLPISGWDLATRSTFEVTGAFPISNNTSQLRFEYTSPAAGASGYLDWVEIIYPRTFDPVNNVLHFRSPDTTAVVEYRLGAFSGAVSVFNVTDPANVTRVSTAGGVFKAEEIGGRVSEYLALTSAAYKQPAAALAVPNQNLHGITDPYDFIIITSDEYRAASNRLKDFRSQPSGGGLRTIVVTVDQIYNEFSHGVPDVSAIRDFLKYAYYNWTPQNPPRFVLFFGAASYDYKGILGTRSSFVPTWQTTDYPFNDVYSSATDDFFTRITNSRAPFFISGRLNARTVSEANYMVDKIIAYEERSTRGLWQTRMLFVADDGWTPENPRGEEGSLHTAQAESLAEQFAPDIFEKRKIYLEEYPAVQTSQGRRKPGAYQDIIDEINRGALIVNFTGHGNPTVWAHENVFHVNTSIPQLTNGDKLSVFFGATCNFSQYDDPRRYTGAELLINKENGGAIGVVSASRKVFADQNYYLNRGIYAALFTRDQFGRTKVERVATAIYLFKQNFNNDNDEKYLLLGDPTMRLQFPRGYVSIDTINAQPVDSVNGVPRISPIQLRALARITVKGTVRNAANTVEPSATGLLTLIVNDATRRVTIPTFYTGPFDYLTPGGLIYRGVSSISNGRFTATFVVPKDIAYADSSTRGRLVAYYADNNSSTNGVGYTNKIWVGGTDPNAPVDTAGPAIRIYLGTTYESSLSFRAGDVVNEKPTLFVDLVDSSGINTSIASLGHKIEAWINNSPESKDMTEFYTSKVDNFQAGTVTYPLRDLPRGRNTIKVRAWDTYNNANMAETYFEVRPSDQLAVVDVMNYPNPFTKSTAFTFRHNQAVPVNATVKVYTVAGRLIQTLEAFGVTEPFVKIPWDGRDRDGDELANGVYLYKLIVRTVDGRFTSEVLGKLAIAR